MAMLAWYIAMGPSRIGKDSCQPTIMLVIGPLTFESSFACSDEKMEGDLLCGRLAKSCLQAGRSCGGNGFIGLCGFGPYVGEGSGVP